MAGNPPTRRDPHTVRDRLLPRSVLGLVVLILAAAVGAAFSGTVLYAYYSYQLNKTNQKVASYVSGFDQRFHTAEDTISNQTDNAKSQIQQVLEPLLKQQAVGSQMSDALKKAEPSVWFVHTLDANGQPAVGSAFVVSSDNSQSLMLTSYNTVQAATHNPAPGIFVRKGNDDLRATLWTWDANNDLALLIVNKSNLGKLNFSTNDLHVGDRVFALSGLGGSGGSISQGFVNDVSSGLIQDDAAVGTSGQGGPVIDSNGDVVGVASLTYHPLGFSSTGVYFTVPVLKACDHVLRCPGGSVGGVGQQGGA